MAIKTLYVGNLPYTVTEDQLSTHFKAYGATKARIVEGRGFGFVDIEADQMHTAITDKHSSSLDGRTLTVSEAKPREERPRNDSYGGGYGGGKSSGNRW